MAADATARVAQRDVTPMADTAVTAGLPKRGPLTLHRGAAVQWGLALLTVVLVIAPIVPVAFQSFVVGPLYDREWSLTLANYGELFASPVLGELAFNTLVFSAVTTLVAQVVGAVTAILVGRTDIPMRSVPRRRPDVAALRVPPGARVRLVPRLRAGGATARWPSRR